MSVVKFAEMSESGLHRHFYEAMTQDFYTAHEVAGDCFMAHPAREQQKIKADFLLYPRQHLLDIGFADTWFAVEIKTAKTPVVNGFRQAFAYTMSSFYRVWTRCCPWILCFMASITTR